MNEAAAAQVLLLRAYESTGFARWTEADGAWASRTAAQAVGADAPAEDFFAARAQVALRKLEPLDPPLARWRAWRPWRIEWLLLAAVVGFAVGVLVDRIGSGQRINLLAPPVWAVIAWNLAVYVWLLLQALASRRSPGVLRRSLAAWVLRRRVRALRPGDGASRAAWQAFAAAWAERSLPLQAARIALALHVAAAALALGLIAGLYLRGLVLDYRVGWESTFLDAAPVRSLLSTLLAPATALSGIAVPDVAGMQALRIGPGGAGATASAAPWIHLYAWQLLLLVVLPRLALALAAAWRARGGQRHFGLPLDEPYFQRLRWWQRGGSTPVQVWPHAHTPDAAALAAAQGLFARVFGDGLVWQVEPTVTYGAEDEFTAAASDGALRVALFDLGATPEAESQGRLLQALAARGAAPLVLVDEAAFAQRFGATSPRLAERRMAWSTLATSLGRAAVFVNLRSPDLSVAEAALQAALMVQAP
jgi:hypothetical protein